ncbi:MAG TPA: hypothetical protein ENK55_05210 [Actinobacteria bacterium]|nr:hypothetical protein [Actinomycetota bacterium]
MIPRSRARLERKILRLGRELAALRAEEARLVEELAVLRHLDDDARRDALVTDDPFDRADARRTAADVARAERNLAALRAEIDRLERRRAGLLDRI